MKKVKKDNLIRLTRDEKSVYEYLRENGRLTKNKHTNCIEMSTSYYLHRIHEIKNDVFESLLKNKVIKLDFSSEDFDFYVLDTSTKLMQM